jgi:tRNA (cytidine/uridine-2'-O-)-methyltransferase
VKPLGFHLGERRLRRAGLDYWAHVDPVLHDSFAAFERELPRLGVPFFMTVEGPGNLFEIEIPEDAAFLFGSEGRGLPHEVRERYRDRLVRLPIVDPRVRSLNLSTAVGVMLYEAPRRRL